MLHSKFQGFKGYIGIMAISVLSSCHVFVIIFLDVPYKIAYLKVFMSSLVTGIGSMVSLQSGYRG